MFNNYGPRETNRHIIPEILEQLKSGDCLKLGNTKPQRDYIHTSDCARAMRLLAKLPPQSSRTVNISSGHHASVDGLIQLLGEILGRKLEVATDPSRFRKADKLVQVADISLLKKLTGWQPEIELSQGLNDLLRFEELLPVKAFFMRLLLRLIAMIDAAWLGRGREETRAQKERKRRARVSSPAKWYQSFPLALSCGRNFRRWRTVFGGRRN